MRILFLGDVVGKAGRRAVRTALAGIVGRQNIAFVVANCENAAAGTGVDPRTAEELLGAGVDVLTSGNHVWRRKEIIPYISGERAAVLLRPANYPKGVPGLGCTVRELAGGSRVAVLNLVGRVFMDSVDCPFQTAERIVPELRAQAPVVIVDMHAEATSEKGAMGWFLDGKVTAVLGTHTHVQTADERILPEGTAYVTDVGMCGPTESVIGMRRREVIQRFVTRMPAKFEAARGPAVLQGVIVDVDEVTGRAAGLRRLQDRIPE